MKVVIPEWMTSIYENFHYAPAVPGVDSRRDLRVGYPGSGG